MGGGISGIIGGLVGGGGGDAGGGSWATLLINIAVTVGLDLISNLFRPNVRGPQLRDLQYSSSAYGGSIARCRGTVRLPGNIIWGTPIEETQHTGGGQTTYTYRVSLAVAFARGPADRFLTIYVDGKRLYSTQVTNASMTGTVTSAAAGKGATNVTLQTGASSSLTLDAGAIIQFYEGPGFDYQVQNAVSIGPSSSVEVGIWPPTGSALSGGNPITIPGLQGDTWDTTWFQGLDSDGNSVTGSCAMYLGTATQGQDPTMVAHQGADNVPGYRGLVYIVLTDFQLINAGNRVPMFSAEIAFDSPDSGFPMAGPIKDTSGTTIAVGTGGGDGDSFIIPGGNIPGGVAVQLPYVFVYHPDPSGNFGTLYRINRSTNVCEGSILLPPAFGAKPVVDYDGYVYVAWSPALDQFRIDKFDAVTGDYIDGMPHYSPVEGAVPYTSQLSLIDDIVTGKKWLVASGAFGGLWVYDRSHAFNPNDPGAAVISYVVAKTIGSLVFTAVEGLEALLGKKPGMAFYVSGDTVLMASSAKPCYCVLDKHGNFWYAQGEHVVNQDISVLWPPPAIDVTMGHTNIQDLAYDPVGDTLLVWDLDSSITRLDLTGTPIATYSVGTLGEIATTPGSAVDALGTWAVPLETGGWTRLQVNTLVSGGTPTTTFYSESSFFTPAGVPSGAVYDGASNSIWVSDAGSVYRLYLDRGGAGTVNLADVIAWLCQDAGLDSSQYDVSRVLGGVGGVQLERQTVKESLLQIMPIAGPLDAAEIDGKLVFVPRGGAAAMTIPEDDLGALTGPDKQERRLAELLQREIDTPYRVVLKYYDSGRDHQQAAQDARRISQPYASDLVGGRKVMNSRNEFDLTLPIAWSSDPVKQAAEKLLYDFWVSRFTYTWKTGIKYLRLDPTDIVDISYQGITIEARLTQADRGAALALEFSATASDSGIYTSVAVGSTGGANLPPTQVNSGLPAAPTSTTGFYVNGT